MTVAIEHPLLDGAGPGWAATETRADVIHLGVGMSDFLHRVAGSGIRPIIVSDPRSRMTQPLAEALSASGGQWVIRTGSDGLYDARTGVRLTTVDAALHAPHPTPENVHPEFLDTPIASRLQVVTTVSTRHRVSRPVRLGGVLEAATAAFADAPPAAWGPTEPLVATWDRVDLTERSRRRMPLDSRWAAVAPGDHPVISTVHIARTSEGLEETTRVWADIGGAGDPRSAAADDSARAFLVRAAGIGMPLLGVAFAAIGAPDLARRATVTPPPEPLAVLIGPPAIRALGVDPAAWAGRVDGTIVGSPRLPGMIVALGSTDGGGGWQRLADVLATLDPAKVSELLAVAPQVSAQLRGAGKEA